MTNRKSIRMSSLPPTLLAVGLVLYVNSLCFVPRAEAAFHLMQIEQIIGGVNGDTTAQAIQLRMRSGGQNFVSSTSLKAVDAAGSNQVVLEDLAANVPNGQAGRRVLITTPNFANYTDIPLVSDFTMDPIPESYLAAGQVRFNDNGNTIYWSLSWGGSAFTGSTTGLTTNDLDGNFGPPVDIALPSTSLQALRFTGAASALSTNNLADYALTTGAATFINNAGTSFTLVAPIEESADFDEDGDVDGRDFLTWQRGFGTLSGATKDQGDADNNGSVNSDDLVIWKDQYGSSASITAIPEPSGLLLSFTLLLVTMRASHRRP